MLSALVVGGIFLGSAARASACSCASSTVEAYFEKADVVFEGRVIAMEPAVDDSTCTGFCDQAVTVRLAVVQRWKGELGEEAIAHTRRSGAACGFPFETGQSYLVYAAVRGEGLLVHLCSGTRPRENAEEHLRFLQAGVVPLDPPHATDDADSFPHQAPSQSAGCQSCALAASPAPPPLLVWVGAFGLGFFGLRRRRRSRARPTLDSR